MPAPGSSPRSTAAPTASNTGAAALERRGPRPARSARRPRPRARAEHRRVDELAAGRRARRSPRRRSCSSAPTRRRRASSLSIGAFDGGAVGQHRDHDLGARTASAGASKTGAPSGHARRARACGSRPQLVAGARAGCAPSRRPSCQCRAARPASVAQHRADPAERAEIVVVAHLDHRADCSIAFSIAGSTMFSQRSSSCPSGPVVARVEHPGLRVAAAGGAERRRRPAASRRAAR